MKLTARLLALGLSALISTAPAMAQDWAPKGPLTINIGFGAGGSTDTMGRVLAKVMQDNTGWPTVVENKPGGGGVAMFTGISQRPAWTRLLEKLTLRAKFSSMAMAWSDTSSMQ